MGVKRIILVADDSEDDICLLKCAFSQSGINVAIHFVRDGEEAICYLRGDHGFADRGAFPYPELMLLDIKMPKVDGFSVLEWVRRERSLKRVPIVMLTSSQEPRDIDHAYDLGANSYLTKPCDFQGLTETVKWLDEYWLKLNRCS
jgi:CheY-like chemotaxis protein